MQVIDLQNTALQRIGDAFAFQYPNLTTVTLPDTVTEVGNNFLRECNKLQVIDLQNTALQRIGDALLFNIPI